MDPDFVPGLVSVIVPTYNRAHLIERALDSVAAQSYRPIQLIVVDDGSSDDTAALVERWKRSHEDERLEVIALQKTNGGAPSARNEGLRRCQGEFVQFLDSDDMLAPAKIDLQVRALEGDPAAMFAWSGFKVVDPADRQGLGIAASADGFRQAAPRDVPSRIVTGLFRRSACLAIGPWSESLIRFQDWEYSVRYTQLGARSLASDTPLYLIVSHSSARIDDVNKDRIRALHCHGEAIASAAAAIGDAPTKAARLRLGRRAVSAVIAALALGDVGSAARFMRLARHYLGLSERLRLKSEALFIVARLSGRRAGSRLAQRVLG
jgi:glycosyltransferase involved in cell wall biosynthesis